ncbi:hypothetical protein RsS62_28770 [Rhizobium dioscoreae]|uniref:hypothetical protein n=1 Tax=Rhizobium TaxID=379 RepID=UPI001198FBB1|nr:MULTISPECIES: hypothetical protein [Rhizobium]MCZ3376954.1 hypothetical protein [Rhizobium sp. AG207R]TWB12531.1 hypothetical protein FBZ99_10690 [Rhizobium sp. ERR1071]GES43625.1 hypothetical protein RsS62_28770 [Rhizobium dioscoreae]
MNFDTNAEAVRRINLRILPFLMLLYLVAYIDRSNISVAALGMNEELGLTSQMYGLAAGIFFATYIVFEIPSSCCWPGSAHAAGLPAS